MPNKITHAKKYSYYPQNYPVFMSGKLTYKIKLKTDYVRTDGTCAAFIQMFLDGEKKILPLRFSVEPALFDKKKQRVKSNHPHSNDYNLIIEKILADINAVEVDYRLRGKILTMDLLMEDLNNPNARIDFVRFWDDEMIRQKELLKKGTYRQQMSVLQKIKGFREVIYFNELNEELIDDLKAYCKNVLKNNPATIATTIKSVKKYLHIAEKRGINCTMKFSDIKNKSFKGNRTFLMPDEITKLYKYWQQDYINETHKNILSRFLFSCFTGLRISDSLKLTDENIIADYVVFTSEKTGKFQRIPLNKTAKMFIDGSALFYGNYTPEYINRELKFISKVVGITKNVTFHVSRHTFATNFLICGGRVEHLQKILGHSKIEDTMVYVHIVESITNIQIHNLDEILNPSLSPTLE